MDGQIKSLSLDLNNNLNGDPLKPLIPSEMVSALKLLHEEEVQVIQDNEAWVGKIYHHVMDNQVYWYVSIDPGSWEDLAFRRFPVFRKMAGGEAEFHFNWFKSRIPENMELFSNTYMTFDGERPLDYSVCSLFYVWDWFLSRMDDVREHYNYDLPQNWKKNDRWITNNAEWTRHIIGLRECDYTFGMFELVMDLGIYFGEVCTRNLKGLDWAYHNSVIDKNKPLLIGSFVVNPFKVIFDLERDQRTKDALLHTYKRIARTHKLYMEQTSPFIDELA